MGSLSLLVTRTLIDISCKCYLWKSQKKHRKDFKFVMGILLGNAIGTFGFHLDIFGFWHPKWNKVIFCQKVLFNVKGVIYESLREKFKCLKSLKEDFFWDRYVDLLLGYLIKSLEQNFLKIDISNEDTLGDSNVDFLF